MTKMSEEATIECPICKRDTPNCYQEEHHLIPRSIRKRKKYKKLPELKKGQDTITVCCSCGDQLHKLFTVKELADDFRTIVAIVANEEVQNWVKWIKKKPDDFSIGMKGIKK